MQARTKVLAGLASLALAGTVGVGVAQADPSPTPNGGSSAGAAPTAGSSPTTDKAKDKARPGKANGRRAGGAKAGHRPLVARALHGEVTLGGKKHRVVEFQRGTVEAVSASSITVRSADGFSATYVVGPATKVRAKKETAAIGDVATADRVRVTATKDGDVVTARRIGDRGPK